MRNTSLEGFVLSLAVASLLAQTGQSAEVVHLRAINPKAAYRPGDVVTLEMVCAAGMTETASVELGPGFDVSNSMRVGKDGIVFNIDDPVVPALRLAKEGMPKCPRAIFEINVPRDFVGRGVVSAIIQRGELHRARFSFKVRSDIPPADLHITSSGAVVDPDECSTLDFDPDHLGPVPVQFVAEQPDGTIFDLCKGADVRVTTDPSEWFRFTTDGRTCSITSRREGSFKLVASYGGLRKEFSCRAQNFEGQPSEKPAPSPVPAAVSSPPPMTAVEPGAARLPPRRPGDPPPMSIPDFRQDPHKLDRHPMDVGRCRLVEHWTTGYCYVYSLRGSEKVSENTDVPCDDLGELRKRMSRAIEKGHCD